MEDRAGNGVCAAGRHIHFITDYRCNLKVLLYDDTYLAQIALLTQEMGHALCQYLRSMKSAGN